MTHGTNWPGLRPALAFCLMLLLGLPSLVLAGPGDVFLVPGGQPGSLADLGTAVRNSLGSRGLTAASLDTPALVASMQPGEQSAADGLRVLTDLVLPDPLPGLYLLAGPWNGGNLRLDNHLVAPFRIGLMHLRPDRGWFVQGGFLMDASDLDKALNLRIVPESGLHQSVVQLLPEETVAYTWADTILNYNAVGGGPWQGLWNLSLGGGSGNVVLGASAELVVRTGNPSDPGAFLEANRDEWKEVWTNSAPSDEKPVLVLDHIELRERRAPSEVAGFSVFLPLTIGPHQLTAAFVGSSSDNSLLDTSSYYPTDQTGLFAFETGTTSLIDQRIAMAGGLAYSYRLDTGAGDLRLGLSGWAAFEPSREITSLSIRQSWSNIGTEIYASFRQEVEELVRSADVLLWGSGVSLRLEPFSEREGAGRFLTAALEADIQFYNESALVGQPGIYRSWVERADNNGDADFLDPGDTVKTLLTSTSIVDRGIRLITENRLSLPVALRFPLINPGHRRISDARLDLMAGIELQVELEIMYQRQGKVARVSTNTERAGDEAETEPFAEPVYLPIGHDSFDLDLIAGACWDLGLLLSLRGGASLQVSIDGSGLESPVNWSIRSLIPLQ